MFKLYVSIFFFSVSNPKIESFYHQSHAIQSNSVLSSTVRPQEHFQIRWGTSPFGGIDMPLCWNRVMYLQKIRGDQSPLSLSVPPGMNLVSTWQYNSRIHLARLLCAQRASKPTSAIYFILHTH